MLVSVEVLKTRSCARAKRVYVPAGRAVKVVDQFPFAPTVAAPALPVVPAPSRNKMELSGSAGPGMVNDCSGVGGPGGAPLIPGGAGGGASRTPEGECTG